MLRWFDSIRDSWDKLSDRERRMLSIMGGVLLAMIVLVGVWTTSSALAEVEEERDAIRRVLADIDRAKDMLAKREAERRARKERYNNKAPALAAYMEGKAKAEGLEIKQVVEEPEKEISGYRRQGIRITFSGVSLRPVMHLLEAVESERSPMAIQRLAIDHYTTGDVYKVDLGITSFEKAKRKGKGEDKEPGAKAEDENP